VVDRRNCWWCNEFDSFRIVVLFVTDGIRLVDTNSKYVMVVTSTRNKFVLPFIILQSGLDAVVIAVVPPLGGDDE
jgi:hypothetical protein